VVPRDGSVARGLIVIRSQGEQTLVGSQRALLQCRQKNMLARAGFLLERRARAEMIYE
jgi:hypothetical protein